MAETIILKRCSKCQESKPLTEFWRDKRWVDGHNTRCKTCLRNTGKKYRQSPKGKETTRKQRQSPAYVEAQLRYRKSEKGKVTQTTYNATPQGKTVNAKTTQAWRAANRDKVRGHQHVNKAVRNGRLPSATSLECVRCGKPATEYHHHNGYEAIHLLDIIPVCAQCHVALDRA